LISELGVTENITFYFAGKKQMRKYLEVFAAVWALLFIFLFVVAGIIATNIKVGFVKIL